MHQGGGGPHQAGHLPRQVQRPGDFLIFPFYGFRKIKRTVVTFDIIATVIDYSYSTRSSTLSFAGVVNNHPRGRSHCSSKTKKHSKGSETEPGNNFSFFFDTVGN